MIAIAESTPSPIAVNMETFIGHQNCEVAGSAAATLGVALPSFIVILIIAKFYNKFRTSEAVVGIMIGLKPSVVGMIAAAVISIGSTVLFPEAIGFSVMTTPAFICSPIIFGVMVIIEFFSKINVHPKMRKGL